MSRRNFRDSDPVEEILRIAMEKQGGADMTLRERLLASGAELGISEKAILEAEQEWLAQKDQEREHEEYREYTLNSLYTHLGIYVVVNCMLVVLNMLTEHGRINWAFWPIWGWGIGIGCHLVAAVMQLKNPSGHDYERWLSRRHRRGRRQSGISVGVHIPPPHPVDIEQSQERNRFHT